MDTRFDFRAFVFALTACAFLGISLPDAQAQTQGGGGGGGGAGGEETGDKAGSDVVSRQLGQFSVTNFAGFVGRQISRAGGNLGALILTVDLPVDARGQRGAPAGDTFDRMAGWANFADTDLEEDVVATRYEGDLRNYILGLDYQVDDRTLAGMAFGLERGEIATLFNGGTLNLDGKTVSPYVSYRFDDRWSADAILGYTRGDIDQVRFAGATPVTSDTTFDRYFAQVNGNYVTPVPDVDNLLLSGQLGYTHAFEKIDAFTESNGTDIAGKSNPLSQVQLALRGGYSLFDIADGWVFHPYAGLRYLFELNSNTVDVGAGQTAHPNDRNEGQFALGVDVFSGSRLSGNFEFTRSFARRDFNSTVLSVNLRWAFAAPE